MPSRTDCVEGALQNVEVLEVLVPHFAVVPGRVMFCEVIFEVEFSGSPGEIKLLLVDSIFHPPIPHV